MKEITVRTATPEDLPLLLDFEQALINAERPFDVTIRPDPVSYYDIESYVLDPEVEVVVAVYKDQVVSSGYALKKRARSYLDHEIYAYLGFMYTIPEFRGMGINRKVVERLMEWANKNDLKEVRLTVYNENMPAIRAYEKAGFKCHITEMRLRND